MSQPWWAEVRDRHTGLWVAVVAVLAALEKAQLPIQGGKIPDIADPEVVAPYVEALAAAGGVPDDLSRRRAAVWALKWWPRPADLVEAMGLDPARAQPVFAAVVCADGLTRGRWCLPMDAGRVRDEFAAAHGTEQQALPDGGHQDPEALRARLRALCDHMGTQGAATWQAGHRGAHRRQRPAYAEGGEGVEEARAEVRRQAERLREAREGPV